MDEAVLQMQIMFELSCRTYTYLQYVCCLSLQVSMAVCYEISSEMAINQPPQPPPSAGSKKGKGKKVKDVSPIAQIGFRVLLTCTVSSRVYNVHVRYRDVTCEE